MSGRWYLVQQLRLQSGDTKPRYEEILPSEAIDMLKDVIHIKRDKPHRYWLEWRADGVPTPD